MNPKVNYELWVIIMYQCRLIFDKIVFAIFLLSADNEGANADIGMGSVWEIYAPPA